MGFFVVVGVLAAASVIALLVAYSKLIGLGPDRRVERSTWRSVAVISGAVAVGSMGLIILGVFAVRSAWGS